MQLYSVEQKRSQALEAHAAAFSVLNNAGTQSTVISFAQKMYNNGVLTSKLHVIELGAQPGKPKGYSFLLCSMNCQSLSPAKYSIRDSLQESLTFIPDCMSIMRKSYRFGRTCVVLLVVCL